MSISITDQQGNVVLAQASQDDVALEMHYQQARTRVGDIHEHIDTLYAYATECESVIECGVETAVSSWAFVKGLRDNSRSRKRLLSIDVNYHPNIYAVKTIAGKVGVDYQFRRGSDLDVEIEDTDMTFIDTWHVDEHLWRELNRFAPRTKKYIVMHDTVVDGEQGETVRRGWNPLEQSKESGYPISGIVQGLQVALKRFLTENSKEWRQRDHFNNCNGLTILERIPVSEEVQRTELTKKIASLQFPQVEKLGEMVGDHPVFGFNSLDKELLGKYMAEINETLATRYAKVGFTMEELELMHHVYSDPRWFPLLEKLMRITMDVTQEMVPKYLPSSTVSPPSEGALSAWAQPLVQEMRNALEHTTSPTVATQLEEQPGPSSD